MPKNEDGEFELILGNRQLLTVFFIVVVLFGIFFAMGYILGRPAGAPEVASTAKAAKPLVVESPGRDANPTPPVTKTEPAPQPPPVEKPKPVETAKVEPEKVTPPKPEPKKPESPKSKPEPAKAAAPAPASGEPAAGSYLQLTATTQHEATLYVDVLKKKGFKAIVVAIPDNHALFRVLVGPMADGSVNKTKADLKAAGFPGDKAIKRTY